jgi:hypothetical protein
MEASATEVEIFTVGLISQAVSDLAKAMERSRLSGVDIVNRAISLYAFLDEALSSGSELLLRRPDGEIHSVDLI